MIPNTAKHYGNKSNRETRRVPRKALLGSKLVGFD